MDKLIINNKTYTVDTLSKLPENLNHRKLAEKDIGNDILGFGGCFSPLSNHHRCDFEVHGVRYSSMEQFLMSEKAKLFNDHNTSKKVMSTDDCVQQLQFGKHVSGFKKETWEKQAVVLAERGLRAKFQQNPSLREHLVATGSKRLVEASPMTPFGE